jgi:SEC-C motif domain protein
MSSRRAKQPAPGARRACPCGLDAAYAECCGALHAGRGQAATAEALMRSRYSAFCVNDQGYLLRTWHPLTRPARLEPDGRIRWRRLEVLAATGGSAFHTEGTVRFRAHFTVRGEEDVLVEHSRFVRHDGLWVYHGPLPEGGPAAG